MADLFVTLASITPISSREAPRQADSMPGTTPLVKDGVISERSFAVGPPSWTSTPSTSLSAYIQDSFLRTASLDAVVLTPLLDGLLGFWKLDGNATDAWGGHNGTSTNITYSLGNGKLGQGAGFNGSSSNIVMAAGIPLDSNNWTIACWWKPNSTGTWDRFFSYYGNGPTIQRVSGTTQIRLVHAATADWSPVGLAGTLGVWSHVAFTRSGTTFAAYKNGGLVDSTILSVTYTADNTVRLGNSAAAPTEWFNGALDEAGIWNRALTLSEIAALYNGGAGLAYPF